MRPLTQRAVAVAFAPLDAPCADNKLSIFELSVYDATGSEFSMEKFRDKVMLVTNTAQLDHSAASVKIFPGYIAHAMPDFVCLP